MSEATSAFEFSFELERPAANCVALGFAGAGVIAEDGGRPGVWLKAK